MSKLISFRRALVVVGTAVGLMALSVGQALAGGGSPPFPK